MGKWESGQSLKQCLIVALWTMIAPIPSGASDICPFSKLYLALKMSSMCGVCQFHRNLKAIFRNVSNLIRYFYLKLKGSYFSFFFFFFLERKNQFGVISL